YMDLLNLPWNVTDEFGFPIASYAALRLVRIGAGREVIERVKRDLESATAVSLNQAYRLRSILEGLKGSADPALRQYVASALARMVARIEYLEEKSRIDEAQSLQRNWNALGVTPVAWRSYQGPNHELWLVSRASDGPNSPPLALAVRAEVIRRAVA